MNFVKITNYSLWTHADRQDVDISVTVCVFVCFYVRLRISLPRIKLAASNFTRRFICVPGRESPIFVKIIKEDIIHRNLKSAGESASARATHTAAIYRAK